MELLENKEPIKFDEITKNFKRDNFIANSLICEVNGLETQDKLVKFHKELEDLMRKYKVIQTVATIFAKL